jgi:multidrug efflux pump subunit AcrA (membrane-fusion protein)
MRLAWFIFFYCRTLVYVVHQCEVTGIVKWLRSRATALECLLFFSGALMARFVFDATIVLPYLGMLRALSRAQFWLRLSLASVAFVLGCSKEQTTAAPEAPVVQVVTVKRRDLPLSREFVGRTVGSIDADVRARVQGTLLEQHFEDGTEVTEGQLLYSIDQAPFLAKLAQAEGKLAETKTKLVQAEADLARIKPLAAIDAVSKRELDMANATKGVAEGAVQAATAGVDAAKIELGYTKVLAPVSGTIGISKVKVGEISIPNSIILNPHIA